MAERVFTTYDTSDENVLLHDLKCDLKKLGIQPDQRAEQIVATARSWAARDEPQLPADRVSEIVTLSDAQWYWELPPLARAATLAFDRAVRGDMWLQFHQRHISTLDLEIDLARSIPTYTDAWADDEGPLPIEVKRRVMLFLGSLQGPARDEFQQRKKNYHTINDLLRAEIRAGRV